MAKILSEGTLKNRFAIGKSEIGLENSSGVLLVEDASNNLIYTRVKKVNDNATPNANDVATYFDLAGKIANITFDFAGASAPSAGTNTGEFGFCHTSGSTFNAGEVYYDNGTSLIEVLHCTHLTTSTAITGTISLLANGSYALDGGTWTLKGDGSGSGEPTGTLKTLKIPFAYTDTTVNSTTSLLTDTEIVSVAVRKSQAFNGTTPTLLVQRGVTLLATADNDLTSTIADLSLEPIKILADGVVALTLTTSGASAGAGDVIITYSTTQNV
jgi:hypothetical protein